MWRSINWLDDHSRYLLASLACRRVTGQTVITTFLAAVDRYGLPQSTLTDNGSVYTSRFTGGRNGFEYLLSRDRSFEVLRANKGFVLAMAAGSIIGTILGGLLLGAVPEGVLIPLLVALLLASSVKVWRHD